MHIIFSLKLITFADAHHIEEEIPLVLVLITYAAQLRMRLERAPVSRVAVPDWIRIQSGQWIRIRIQGGRK
jgi:hypothetical protein